ncbi:hypothetical protein N7471_003848 [Penicillium samsonianum]|nr:hypothetical protein N7471_003848 [Penicillium samsonianum]
MVDKVTSDALDYSEARGSPLLCPTTIE